MFHCSLVLENLTPFFEGATVVREHILKELRDRACVRGKQRTWVSALSDEQLYELFMRLRNGESAKSIARHAQQVWKVKRNSSVHSLSQGILKFRRRISHLLVNQPTVSGTPSPRSCCRE